MVGIVRDSIAPPAVPATGSQDRNPWDAAVDAAVRREEGYSWWLDSFQNAAGTRTDRQMLSDAMTAAAAQTQPPAIKLGPRDHDFSASATTGYNVFPGFALVGPRNQGIGTIEQGTKGAACRALFNGGTGVNSMFYANGGSAGASIYSPMVCNDIAWRSTNGASEWLHAPFSAVNMYGPTWGNLEFTGFYRCIGAPGDGATITLGTMWGAWNIPNMAGTPFTFRGSDNWLVPDTANIGWNAGPTGEYLVRLEAFSKSFVRGLYLTARLGSTRALLIDNQDGSGRTQGGLTVSDCVIEGQNNGEPAAGALIYINQHGVLNIHDIALNFYMGNPTPFSPNDTAAIIANLGSGGLLNIHDINVTRAAGVSQDIPFLDMRGSGKASVKNIFGMPGNGASGQVWTDLPAVQNSGTGYMETDGTVRLLSGFSGVNTQYPRQFLKAGDFAANDFAGWPTGARIGDMGVSTTNGRLFICTAATTSTTTWTLVGGQS